MTAVRKRTGFSLVEVAVAVVVLSGIIYGGVFGARYVISPARRGEATLEQLTQLQIGAEALEREFREARHVIYPFAAGEPSRIAMVRNFDGQVDAYYFDPARRELRKARLDPKGLAVEERRPLMVNLNGAYFAVSRVGLVSWGIFSPDSAVLGSVRRENK